MTNFCIIIVKAGIKSAILAIEVIVKIVNGRLHLFLFLIPGECKSFIQPINYFFEIVTLFLIFQFCQKKDNLLVFVDNFRKFYYCNKKKMTAMFLASFFSNHLKSPFIVRKHDNIHQITLNYIWYIIIRLKCFSKSWYFNLTYNTSE